MDDRNIVALFLQRDEEAVHRAQEKYGAYCTTVAGRILANDGDVAECVNDTWLKAWESIPPQQPKSLKHYLAKLTRNLAFNRYKREHTQKRGGGELYVVLDELKDGCEFMLQYPPDYSQENIRSMIESLSEYADLDAYLAAVQP